MNSSRPPLSPPPPQMSLSNCEESFAPVAASAVVPGSLNDEGLLRGLVTDAIRNCQKSREVIAEEMTTLLGERVTARMLNSYTSTAAEQHRWPAQYTRAFCHVTGDTRLIRCIAERHGFHLISDGDFRVLELGRKFLAREAAIADFEEAHRGTGGAL